MLKYYDYQIFILALNMYKWKREEIILLIEMVEERACLWDVSHSDYHNQIHRRNGLQEIASKLNIPVDEIKKKIHTLRAQLSKERLKMKTIKSGSGSSEIYKSKWEFFNLLEFMFRHTEKRNTVDSMVSIVLFLIFLKVCYRNRLWKVLKIISVIKKERLRT